MTGAVLLKGSREPLVVRASLHSLFFFPSPLSPLFLRNAGEEPVKDGIGRKNHKLLDSNPDLVPQHAILPLSVLPLLVVLARF